MKRCICLMAAALLLGVYAAFYIPFHYLVLILLFLLVCSLIKWIVSRRISNGIYVVAALVFLLGSFLLIWRGDVTRKALYPFLDEYVTVMAEIVDRPERSEEKVTFEAKITELSFLDNEIFPNETVKLSYYGQDRQLHFGDIITARIRINLPKEALNKGGFDYSLYLKTKNIFFSGYIDSGSLDVIGQKKFTLLNHIRMLGYRCAEVIDNALTPKTACILKGILLGDKSGIDDELYEAFSRSGLSHIIAVSGTHVSSLLVMIFSLFQLCRIHRRRAGIFAILFLFFFICMIGAPASSIRAGIMALLTIFSEFVYRKADTFTSLSVAAIVILCIQPFSAFDVSFLLSFGAVLGILLFQKKLEYAVLHLFDRKKDKTMQEEQSTQKKPGLTWKIFKKTTGLLTTAISAQLIIVPLLFYFFQEFTFWGLITNLIVLPLLSFILASGTLLCLFGFIWEPLSSIPAGISYLGLLAVRHVAVFFGSLDFGYITYGNVTAFFVFFYFLLISALYLLFDRKKRIFTWIPIGSVVVLIGILLFHSAFIAPLVYVRFINVGQGDCSCISLPDGTDILIDAGGTPSYRRYYDIGKNIVRPYLLKNKIYDIEYMIASHGHDDHVQGLISILREMKVERLFVPVGFGKTEAGKQLLEVANEKLVPVTELATGDRIEFSDGTFLSVLMPTKEWAQELSENRENERSLILRFDFGAVSFLYTGDMEKEGEEELIRTAGDSLCVDVLKVAHHGGNRSTAKGFLNIVQPTYAVIPVGSNSFGQPDDRLLARLHGCGATVFRTDEHKDVVFTLDTEKIIDISYDMQSKGERR